MLVEDVMTQVVYVVRKNDAFSSVLLLLDKHNISGVPVVDEKKRVVGIISEKDLLYRLLPTEEEFYKDVDYYSSHERIEKECGKILKLKAKDLMSTDVVSIEPSAHSLQACALMLVRSIRRLPVVESDKLVGIVSTHDIYRNFLKTLVEKDK